MLAAPLQPLGPNICHDHTVTHSVPLLGLSRASRGCAGMSHGVMMASVRFTFSYAVVCSC